MGLSGSVFVYLYYKWGRLVRGVIVGGVDFGSEKIKIQVWDCDGICVKVGV